MPNGAAPALPAKQEAMMALACTLYEQGAPAECFRLLQRLSASGVRTAPLLYNTALCLEEAGQPERPARPERRRPKPAGEGQPEAAAPAQTGEGGEKKPTRRRRRRPRGGGGGQRPAQPQE